MHWTQEVFTKELDNLQNLYDAFKANVVCDDAIRANLGSYDAFNCTAFYIAKRSMDYLFSDLCRKDSYPIITLYSAYNLSFEAIKSKRERNREMDLFNSLNGLFLAQGQQFDTGNALLIMQEADRFAKFEWVRTDNQDATRDGLAHKHGLDGVKKLGKTIGKECVGIGKSVAESYLGANTNGKGLSGWLDKTLSDLAQKGIDKISGKQSKKRSQEEITEDPAQTSNNLLWQAPQADKKPKLDDDTNSNAATDSSAPLSTTNNVNSSTSSNTNNLSNSSTQVAAATNNTKSDSNQLPDNLVTPASECSFKCNNTVNGAIDLGLAGILSGSRTGPLGAFAGAMFGAAIGAANGTRRDLAQYKSCIDKQNQEQQNKIKPG